MRLVIPLLVILAFLMWPTCVPSLEIWHVSGFCCLFYFTVKFTSSRTQDWNSFQDAGVTRSEFTSHFSNYAVAASLSEATITSLPLHMTTDLYRTMSDHVLFCGLTALKEPLSVSRTVLESASLLHVCSHISSHIIRYMLQHLYSCQHRANIVTQCCLSVPPSNKGFKNCSFAVL